MPQLTNDQNADKLLGADDADKLLLTASHISGVVCCPIILSCFGYDGTKCMGEGVSIV